MLNKIPSIQKLNSPESKGEFSFKSSDAFNRVFRAVAPEIIKKLPLMDRQVLRSVDMAFNQLMNQFFLCALDLTESEDNLLKKVVFVKANDMKFKLTLTLEDPQFVQDLKASKALAVVKQMISFFEDKSNQPTLDRVETLDLGYCYIPEENQDQKTRFTQMIPKCKNLRKLNYNFTTSIILPNGLTHLTHLHFKDCMFLVITLSNDLSNLSFLQFDLLGMNGTPDYTKINFSSSLPNLTHLHFGFIYDMTITLPNVPCLHSLRLDASFNSNINFSGSLTSLTTLELGNLQSSDVNLPECLDSLEELSCGHLSSRLTITSAEKLRRLNITSADQNAVLSIPDLQKLPKLNSVSFSPELVKNNDILQKLQALTEKLLHENGPKGDGY